MSLWHIQEIGQLSQPQQPRSGTGTSGPSEERMVAREVGSISITKVKNRGIRRPRANKKNVTDNVGTIASTEDGNEPKKPRKKRMRPNHEKGVQPRVYNPLAGEVPAKEFGVKLMENLQSINSDAMICKILGSNINWDDTVETKFGQFPRGSTVAMQQKLVPDLTSITADIIASNNPPSPSPPPPPSCNLSTNLNMSNQVLNEFSHSLRTPHIPIQGDQDFYSHLNTRSNMQDHGYDFTRPPLWH